MNGETEGWAFDEPYPEAYRMLVEGAPAILYIDRPDESSANLYTSPQVEALLGFTVEEWTSDQDLWVRQLHPDDRDRVIDAHLASNRTGERFLEEYRVIAKDGRTVWLRDDAVPVRDAAGALLFWRGVILDITGRKQVEEELSRARERLQALIDHIPAVVYVESPDADPESFYLSDAVEWMFGYTVEGWTRTPDFWFDRIHPDDRTLVADEDERSDLTRDRYVSEYRFRTNDGSWMWVHDEAVFVPGGDGEGFWQGFIFDITRRKQAEERQRWSLEVLRQTLLERRELARRLQHAQEAERRRIAADIHDDPIQVMSAVDMRLQMLASYPQSITTEEIVGIERDVRAAIDRLRSMLFELRPPALDRDGLVPALRLYVEHTARTTGWQTELHDALSDDLDPDLRAVLYRIVQEAVVNTRKHAEASRVEIEVASAAQGVTVRVRDDGVGFTPNPDATPEPGHLGLSTMVERAELAGGWVRVQSAPGEGTVVECWLPLDVRGDRGLAEV